MSDREVKKSRQEKSRTQTQSIVLLGSVFVIANCGLVYELLAGTISSYLVGAAILQFSLVVGVFMAAMGIGAFLSQWVKEDLLDVFVRVEVAVGFLGGFSAFALFFAFVHLAYYTAVLYAVCGLIGIFIGMEIPLVIRLLKDELALEFNVSAVLGLDYLGALIASLVFPLVLLPYLGQLATAFFTGLLNVVVAIVCCIILRDHLKKPRTTIATAVLAALLLAGGLAGSHRFVHWFESSLYQNQIIYATDTKYQRMVLTRWRDDLRLYLNGNLQFSSIDEYRYHDSLVHSVMGMPGKRERVLVLGGGDGMAVREVLKYADVKQVDLVDLDPEMTRLFSEQPMLRALNEDALHADRVSIYNMDAQIFLEEHAADAPYDRIIIDFPDPNDTRLGKLYSRSFYRLLSRHLSGSGYAITQATAPYLARRSFWCIYHTIRSVEHPAHLGETLDARAMRTYVPSFGEWGFVLFSPRTIDLSQWRLTEKTRYLTQENFESHFLFSEDTKEIPTEINRLDDQVLVRYYQEDWKSYFR